MPGVGAGADYRFEAVKTVHLLRLLTYILMAAALLIAIVPLLVLLSLVQGGSGFGLCPDGITSCSNPYTAAPELTAGLTIALLVIVAAIRILMRAARRLEADEYRVEGDTPEGGVDQSNERATR